MPIKEADKRNFRLGKLRESLDHLRKTRQRLHSFERLSTSKDFSEFREFQQFSIRQCENHIIALREESEQNYLSIEQERKNHFFLHDEITRKKTLEEMLQYVDLASNSMKKLEENISAIEAEIKELEEENIYAPIT